jgi:hypothetical protein
MLKRIYGKRRLKMATESSGQREMGGCGQGSQRAIDPRSKYIYGRSKKGWYRGFIVLELIIHQTGQRS